MEKTESKGERIAKRLARAGVCSRRDAEKMIAEGRVILNGKVLTSPAINVLDKDSIKVDGKLIAKKEKTRVWCYHKPKGLVTSHNDEQGRETIFNFLPKGMPRVISVGRLDMNSEGLLLLTNNGELSRHLELPSTGWERAYRVRAFGNTSQEKLDRLKNGIRIKGVSYEGIEATLDKVQGANIWMTMVLKEGKNREIRRVLEHLGLKVNRLIRTSYGPFPLGNIAEGGIEEVPPKILRDILDGQFE